MNETANKNIFNLQGLNPLVKGKLYSLQNKQVDESNLYKDINSEANVLLVPYYAKATSFFEQTLASFSKLTDLLDERITQLTDAKIQNLSQVSMGGRRTKRYRKRR